MYEGPKGRPEDNLIALNDISTSFAKGEISLIIGPSGSGKTSLLNCIAGLEEPTAGLIYIDDVSLYNLFEENRDEFRSDYIFYIHQNDEKNLHYNLTVRDNLELFAYFVVNKSQDSHSNKFDEIIELLEIEPLFDLKVDQLSGGEKQLANLAIALLHEPKVLLLDEPTSSLDKTTKLKYLEILKQINNDFEITVIIATHDVEISKFGDKIIGIKNGRFDRILDRKIVSKEFSKKATDLMHGEYYWLPVDDKGAIHLPEFVINKYGIEDQVKLVLDEDHIIIIPNRGDLNE